MMPLTPRRLSVRRFWETKICCRIGLLTDNTVDDDGYCCARSTVTAKSIRSISA